MDGLEGGWVGKLVDGWMGGHAGGWMDGRGINECVVGVMNG